MALVCSYDNLVWDATGDTTTATMGFNKNDGVTSYSLPGSFSSPADKAVSCGGRGGCYTFRVDQEWLVVDSSPSPTVSFSTSPTRSPVSASRSPTPSVAASASVTPSPRATLLADLYSGSGPVRDPCVHGLTSLYAFGNQAGMDVMGAKGPPPSRTSTNSVFAIAWSGPDRGASSYDPIRERGRWTN